MKRYGNLYEKIYNLENIKLAHKRARAGKTFYKEVKMVDAGEDKYCMLISEMLKNHTFVNSPYSSFTKIDKGKERLIHKLPYYPDRIVHHAIMQILEPIWKPTLINDTFQSIAGRGIHKAKSRIEPVIRSVEVDYCLKLDIKKFYPSVDNTIMKSVIRRKIKCKETIELLDIIIDSIQGLPIGNYLSQYLGNLYLTYLDHYVKEVLGVKYYYRYCDDIVILSNSKEDLHSILESIREYVQEELKLTIKGDYQIFPISRGIDFIGFRFFKSYTLIRTSIATSLKRAGRTFVKFPSLAAFSSLSSYYGWALVSSSNNLWNSVISNDIVNLAKSLGFNNKIIRSYK